MNGLVVIAGTILLSRTFDSKSTSALILDVMGVSLIVLGWLVS